MACCLSCLVGCNDANKYDKQVKVTFDLAGGTYKNCTLPVVHYYNAAEGQKIKIGEMTAVAGGDLVRTGYVFDGWYRTLNADGSYADEWNFDTDTVDHNGVTLYAKWKKPYKYTYEFCYIDEKTQQKVVIGSAEADEGDVCQLDLASIQYANARPGYTMVDYVDKDGNLWDESFTHPGGEADLAVEVYVQYVEGDYAVVKEPSDFVAGKNIFLARDIDLNGEKLSLSFFTKGVFDGNNHKISNFKVEYSTSKDDLISFDNSDNNIVIGLFGMLNGATVQNVTFENMSIDVKTTFGNINNIYVAPLCGSITGSTLSNVKVLNFQCTHSSLPLSFYQDNDRTKPLKEGKLNVANDRLSYLIDDKSVVTNCTVTAKTTADN